MPRTADSGFDAVVVDRENQPVALIQVKADSNGHDWATILPEQLAKFAERVDYVLTVDRAHIHLYRPAGDNLGNPIVTLDTPRTLQDYDPEFSERRVFAPYLLTLVEAWLRDLAYHWKSEKPAGSEELQKAGLLKKFEGGTTLRGACMMEKLLELQMAALLEKLEGGTTQRSGA